MLTSKGPEDGEVKLYTAEGGGRVLIKGRKYYVFAESAEAAKRTLSNRLNSTDVVNVRRAKGSGIDGADGTTRKHARSIC